MKKTVGIIFGGRSAEHEVSFFSSRNVCEALDKTKYNLKVIGISKEGTWYTFPNQEFLLKNKSLSDKNLPSDAEPVALISSQGKPVLINLKTQKTENIDIAFPVLHGTFGEDGCIQGLFKMANIPFVGCGVLGSSIGMDKAVMKRILEQAQIPAAKYLILHSQQAHSYEKIEKELGTPFFIKPANAGSSVGVHKIKSAQDFSEKLKDSFKYDHKVLAEEFIQGREIECSVMGLNQNPKASTPGEIIPTHEFYSYDAKYIDDKGAATQIPAKLNAQEISNVQKLALKTYTAMECDGLTRVDFFLKADGKLMVNEINTIPGFTNISMYPKMWEATGLKYTELISQLLELGFEKFKQEQALQTNFIK